MSQAIRGRASLILISCLLLACSREHAVPAEVGAPDSAAAPAALDTIPPDAQPGFFAAVTPDSRQISGEWRGRAGECADPPSLQLLVDGDSVNALLLIAFPDSGSRVREYPIVDLAPGAPPPGTARLSVLRILYIGLGYRAVEGAVQLDRVGRRVSGQFDVRLMEATSERVIRYLGTFREIPVGRWAADLCVMTSPDSAAPDSSE